MTRVTEEEKREIQELKKEGFGPATIAKELGRSRSTVDYYYYLNVKTQRMERSREDQRKLRIEQLKAENPERYEFRCFIEDIKAGRDATISCGNYCAQILLLLTSQSGLRSRTIKRKIGMELPQRIGWDLTYMKDNGLVTFGDKGYSLTYKGFKVLQRID